MVEATMITSLVELATSEFADKEAMQKVINLLMESRNNLTTSLAKEVADDIAAVKEFNEDVKLKTAFINKCRGDITDSTA